MRSRGTGAGSGFGDNLKRLRTKAGLTQEGLACRMTAFSGKEWTQNTVSDRERSDLPPSGAFLCAAAAALRVEPFVLLVDLDEPDSADQASAEIHSVHRWLQTV